MAAKPDNAEPRRRFQFRLRTLLLGVTLAGVICAWGVPVVRAWQIPTPLRTNGGHKHFCACRR